MTDSLIDVMARALWFDDGKCLEDAEERLGHSVVEIDPAWYDEDAAAPITGPGFRAQWEGQARAALRAILKHGPTERMLDAGMGWEWSLDLGHREVRGVFLAMLEAELENDQ